jgi:hypothetical protein
MMLRCDLRSSNLYPSLILALRDMRDANGRDPATGDGDGNESWIGLTLGMIVLDTLSGEQNEKPGPRWRRLLIGNGVLAHDAGVSIR